MAAAIVVVAVNVAWLVGMLTDDRWMRLANSALFLSLGLKSLIWPDANALPRSLAILVVAIMSAVFVFTLFQFVPE